MRAFVRATVLSVRQNSAPGDRDLLCVRYCRMDSLVAEGCRDGRDYSWGGYRGSIW